MPQTKKSWMARRIFENYLRKLDRQMRSQKRKILLFVDQCTAHIVDLKLQNIRVEFFPANCTSKAQSCDLGILRSFKVHYRNQLLKNTLLSIESGGKKKSVNVLEALHMISSAWERVGSKCISSSFVKGGFPEVR
ncbi:Tigger transposable element-derived protein 6 [Araneus ventricosus]|uniref:Tigger transposable element-derived protein 6 n=1 Tax=Araneus ventricosus TaxID=182803 RepID=A0A4Y2AL59_ARAVE|nr:Tigger transposable element-derived protein 6 [Araneus ventricosus]